MGPPSVEDTEEGIIEGDWFSEGRRYVDGKAGRIWNMKIQFPVLEDNCNVLIASSFHRVATFRC